VGRLMLRITCFSLIYVLPTGLGVLAQLYQAQNMDKWLVCTHAFWLARGEIANEKLKS
jgi:hypothetical protein